MGGGSGIRVESFTSLSLLPFPKVLKEHSTVHPNFYLKLIKMHKVAIPVLVNLVNGSSKKTCAEGK